MSAACVKLAVNNRHNMDNAKTLTTAKATGNKLQATAEQLRIAQISQKPDTTDDLASKVAMVVTATGFSADAAVFALHDCNNDVRQAVELLFDQGATEWHQQTAKKKKGKAFGSGNNEPELTDSSRVLSAQNAPPSLRPSSKEHTGDRARSQSMGSKGRANQPPRMQQRGGVRTRSDRADPSRPLKNGEHLPADDNNLPGQPGHGRGRRRNLRGRGAEKALGEQRGTFSSGHTGTAESEMKSPGDGDGTHIDVWTGNLKESQVFHRKGTELNIPISYHSDSLGILTTVNTDAIAAVAHNPEASSNKLIAGTVFHESGHQRSVSAAEQHFPGSYNQQMASAGSHSPEIGRCSGPPDSELLETLRTPSLTSSSDSSQVQPSRLADSGATSQAQLQPLQRYKPSKAKSLSSKIPTAAVEMPHTIVSTVHNIGVEFGGLNLTSDNDASVEAVQSGTFQRSGDSSVVSSVDAIINSTGTALFPPGTAAVLSPASSNKPSGDTVTSTSSSIQIGLQAMGSGKSGPASDLNIQLRYQEPTMQNSYNSLPSGKLPAAQMGHSTGSMSSYGPQQVTQHSFAGYQAPFMHQSLSNSALSNPSYSSAYFPYENSSPAPASLLTTTSHSTVTGNSSLNSSTSGTSSSTMPHNLQQSVPMPLAASFLHMIPQGIHTNYLGGSHPYYMEDMAKSQGYYDPGQYQFGHAAMGGLPFQGNNLKPSRVGAQSPPSTQSNATAAQQMSAAMVSQYMSGMPHGYPHGYFYPGLMQSGPAAMGPVQFQSLFSNIPSNSGMSSASELAGFQKAAAYGNTYSGGYDDPGHNQDYSKDLYNSQGVSKGIHNAVSAGSASTDASLMYRNHANSMNLPSPRASNQLTGAPTFSPYPTQFGQQLVTSNSLPQETGGIDSGRASTSTFGSGPKPNSGISKSYMSSNWAPTPY